MNGTTRFAIDNPGHSLLPVPNGMNLWSFPLKSTSSAMSKNLSGMNSSGLSHATGSRMISHTLKITPPISAPSSSARCGTRISAAGCRRITSFTTAWRSSSTFVFFLPTERKQQGNTARTEGRPRANRRRLGEARRSSGDYPPAAAALGGTRRMAAIAELGCKWLGRQEGFPTKFMSA
uniref:Uncharacterized protein n=1 Tax=Oryza nivara TaxID=4536 RepID=A0A0E0IE82_ORYNI